MLGVRKIKFDVKTNLCPTLRPLLCRRLQNPSIPPSRTYNYVHFTLNSWTMGIRRRMVAYGELAARFSGQGRGHGLNIRRRLSDKRRTKERN